MTRGMQQSRKFWCTAISENGSGPDASSSLYAFKVVLTGLSGRRIGFTRLDPA